MWPTLRSVSSLMTGIAILVVGHGMFSTFMALRMSMEGFSTQVVGLVMSAYFMGLVWGSRRFVTIINQVGHIRTFAAMAAVACASVLLAGFFISPIAWLLLRALLGFVLAGLFMVTESWLNERAPTSLRGRVLSIYMIVSYLALGTGQLLLALFDPSGGDLFVIAALAFTLSLVPVALTRASSPAPLAPSTLPLKRLYQISPLGVVGVVASGMITASLYGMGPLFAQRMGFSVSGVSLFMSILITSGLVLQWPVGHLSDLHDRRRIITIITFASSLISLALVLHTFSSPASILLLAGLFGGISFPLYPLVVAHTNDHLQPQERVAATGGLLLIYGTGAIFGPLLGSFAMSWAGPRGLFMFTAATSASLGVFALWRMCRRPPVATELQETFVGLPRTTPIATELLTTSSTEIETLQP